MSSVFADESMHYEQKYQKYLDLYCASRGGSISHNRSTSDRLLFVTTVREIETECTEQLIAKDLNNETCLNRGRFLGNTSDYNE